MCYGLAIKVISNSAVIENRLDHALSLPGIREGNVFSYILLI